MRIKTSELSGKALDWAVAKCEGKDGDCEIHAGNIWYGRVTSGFIRYHPSTNRDQGYEIVERKKININYCRDLRDKNGLYIHAEMNTHIYHGYWRGDHEKPLIAAMRCYVSSELGEYVDVPDEVQS